MVLEGRLRPPEWRLVIGFGLSLFIADRVKAQNVVRETDQCPFTCHFFEPSQQKLGDPAGLFDLAEDRLDNRFTRRIHRLLLSSVASASSLPSALRLSGAARVGKVGDVGHACSYLSPRSHRSCFSEHRLIPDTAGSPRNSSRYPPESRRAVAALAA